MGTLPSFSTAAGRIATKTRNHRMGFKNVLIRSTTGKGTALAVPSRVVAVTKREGSERLRAEARTSIHENRLGTAEAMPRYNPSREDI